MEPRSNGSKGSKGSQRAEKSREVIISLILYLAVCLSTWSAGTSMPSNKFLKTGVRDEHSV